MESDYCSVLWRWSDDALQSLIELYGTHSTARAVECTLGILYALLLARVLSAFRGILRSLSETLLEGVQASHLPEAAPTAPAVPFLACRTEITAVPPSEALAANHAWSEVGWQTIRLRVGPDYPQNRRKLPGASPILQCVGVDVFGAPEKIVGDGLLDAGCLPGEVVAAAAEPTPPPALSGPVPPPLPRYLVVTISMPRYGSGAPDGPNYRIAIYLVVPPTLRDEGGPGPAMLCEFLDGAASGHTERGGALQSARCAA